MPKQHIPEKETCKSKYQTPGLIRNIPDVEQRGTAEGEETPLVSALDQRTHQARDDEYNGHEEGGQDIRKRQTGGQEDLKEHERESDEPLDVPHILGKIC